MKVEDKIMEVLECEGEVTQSQEKSFIKAEKDFVSLEKTFYSKEFLREKAVKLGSTRFTFTFEWFNEEWSIYYVEVERKSISSTVITITKIITPVATTGGVLYV